MQFKHTLRLAVLPTLLYFSLAHAYPNPPHTWHTISTTNSTWDGKLQMLNQGGAFVTRGGNLVNHFTIKPDQSLDYGFSFDNGDDFDVAYTLTLTEKTTGKQYFQSKACVYVVTASGPAKPDIRVSAFNGATCKYNVVHGRGEDFEVS